ncbi:protein PRD1 [Canna indica]|uniref:Protein PRD1 n=1 Tax=Canna indica TaxID=4628 RepID=A0AAQ3KZP6_9LILI|nr:protein PRD1 [Canna indica]
MVIPRGVILEEEDGEGFQMEASFRECEEEEDHDEDEIGDAAQHQHHSGCGKGHRPSMAVATAEGGSICLACLSALLSDPRSLSHHVSYALSQLSAAIQHPDFIRRLADCHPHILVPPLVRALASFRDEPLANQLIDLVSDLSGCGLPRSVFGDFVARVADFLSSGALAWSRQQFFMLHCLGVLLNSRHECNPTSHIRDKAGLFSTLVNGLQLPSEEIRGEILFVLYKMSIRQVIPWDNERNYDDDLTSKEEYLLKLSLEILLKTQKDDVRMNCVALLMVLAQKGIFEILFENDQISGLNREMDELMKGDGLVLSSPLINLFAEAIKGPLLSSDVQLQTNTLDLVFHVLSSGDSCLKQIEALIEKSIADYVFEVLRMSGNKDSLVISCLKVLNILATAEEVFIHRLAVGFHTLLSVFRYVTEIPLHPVQNDVLKLVWTCITNCPGIMSDSQVEEVVVILARIFRRQDTMELAITSETFTLACSTFVELMKLPSACNMLQLAPLIQETSRNAVVSSLSSLDDPDKLLFSLFLVKELFACIVKGCSDTHCSRQELENNIIETCETYLLPLLGRVIDEGQDEEIVLGILETFHTILLKGSEIQARRFAETLVLSSWFSLSFGCLGLFPTEQMKTSIYLILSSVTDRLLGPDFGNPIRDCYLDLPSDPHELIYLIGQSSLHDSLMASCQYAVLMLLYVSSLYGERVTDGNQVLASLEQYILVNNSSSSPFGVVPSIMLSQLVHLYALVRSDPLNYGSPCSAEAEKSIFHLITEMEWDLLSIGLHPRALKWLFQQEEIILPLSCLIMNFCRSYNTNKSQLCIQANCMKLLDIEMIAELIISGDNFAAELMVSLLKESDERKEDDILHLVNVMLDILKIFPRSSDQFSLCGIADAFQRVFYSVHVTETCSLFIFNVLYLANHETLVQDKDWLGITLKLLEHLRPKLASETFGQQELLIVAIFCLILQLSTRQVLREASKAILLDHSLSSAADRVVQAACAKGPALVTCDEGSPVGDTLIFVLLLYLFSLRSMFAIFQETMDWQDFFQLSNEGRQSSLFCIKCHDICRLLHFGSSNVKLLSSQCLVELLTRISDQMERKNNELKCSLRYLESVIAVTEGLIFYGDFRTAMACRACLSMLIGCENFGAQEKLTRNLKWFRIIMEELAMTLAAPSLASRSFINQHKPAAHIAVILLKLDKSPPWMKSVFNNYCISAILENLSACNLTSDMIKLFRELTVRKYLNKEQVDALHHLFQVCRKQVYKDSSREQQIEENFHTVIKNLDDTGNICNILIQLMLSSSRHYIENRPEHEKLLEEIDMFFQFSTTEVQ